MKFRPTYALFLAATCISALAMAQNAPASEKKETARMDPLAFVQIAADVAGNLHENLNNYLGVYIEAKNWPSGLKDSDLGPFLKIQQSKPDRSAACLLSSMKDAAVCVYFDGERAYGATVVHATKGKIEAKDVDAGYKILTKELLEKSNAKLDFEPTDAATDDGVPLPAYLVKVNPLL